MFGSMDTTPVGEYVLDSFPGEWGIEDTNGTGVKVIRTTNFTNSGKLNLTDVITREIEMKKVNKKRIMKYDTILERSGGTTDNPVGRVVLFEEDGLYLCNNFTQVLRFKDIDPRFAFYSLFYFYQTNKTAIRGMGNKTTGIQNLNMSKYLGIGIPNALVEQQKAFTAIAEQADKSKFMRSKSQFIEMFGSKSSGDKWPIKYLSEIVDPNCPISYGIVQPGDELEDGVPIVRPVDLNSNYYVYKNGLKRTTEAISNSYKRTILRGDELLLCVRGTTGVMGLATEELKGGNVTRGITPLYFKEGFNRIYLLGAFLSDDVQAYIKDNTVGSTLKGINMERVRKIQIPIPPIEIQNKWEEVFKQADKSKLIGLLWKHCHCRDVYTK